MKREEILRKKVSDIISDLSILNRLRNAEVHINSLRKFVDSKCFTFISSEIKRTRSRPWACGTCNEPLSGKQVMCDNCLDWHHFECVGYTNSQAKPFFCVHC
jgi:hypothetical protein